MQVTFWPFYSQQDKRTGKFLDTCSTVKMYAYMADKMQKDGHDVKFVVPAKLQRDWKMGVGRLLASMPPCNKTRRLHWDTGVMSMVAKDCDLLITSHDFIAFPMRCLFPELTIVSEAAILPGAAWPEQDPLFTMAWKSNDMMHCNSWATGRAVRKYCPLLKKWPFSYEDSVTEQRNVVRDIDVLFNSRCSSTNYSHHREAMAACPDAYFCDPTGYLGKRPLTREQYLDVLHRSKVVLGLTVGGTASHGLWEAVAAGCCPVTLKLTEYVEVLGPLWPYYCTLDEVSIRETVRRALRDAYTARNEVVDRSYSAAWKQAEKDIEELMA
jgi:hypothetical protein